MELTSTIGTIILLLTAMTTYKGFKDMSYYEDYLFDVDKILVHKEYKRLFTSGFLHTSWIHFGFNMIALVSFSVVLEYKFGIKNYLLIYFFSLIGGNLLALFIHRNHGDYRAVGASGAISGIVLSSVVLYPESTMSLILIPIEFSSWILGLLFILVSIFGIKTQRDNIGHEAHLGGALIGVLMTLFIDPKIFLENWWIVLLILIPIFSFLMLIVKKPEILLIDNYWGVNFPKKSTKSYLEQQFEQEMTLNELLDKIKHKGIHSLTKKEKKRLEQLKDDL